VVDGLLLKLARAVIEHADGANAMSSNDDRAASVEVDSWPLRQQGIIGKPGIIESVRNDQHVAGETACEQTKSKTVDRLEPRSKKRDRLQRIFSAARLQEQDIVGLDGLAYRPRRDGICHAHQKGPRTTRALALLLSRTVVWRSATFISQSSSSSPSAAPKISKAGVDPAFRLRISSMMRVRSASFRKGS
jgi:hypothetical protein